MNDVETGPGTPAKDLIMIDGTFNHVDYNVANYIRRLEKIAHQGVCTTDRSQQYDRLINIIAGIRDNHISKLDPAFLEWHLSEMVSCPEECLRLIEHRLTKGSDVPWKFRISFHWHNFKRWLYA